MIFLITLVFISSNLQFQIEYLKNKNFQVDFTERIFYENSNIVDTFSGTLIRTDKTIEMQVEYPDKTVYRLKGDTLWTYSPESGDSSCDVIPGVYKWLDFSYILNDSVFKVILDYQNSLITILPRDTLSQFKEAHLILRDSLVKELEIKLEDRSIYFEFSNWRFL